MLQLKNDIKTTISKNGTWSELNEKGLLALVEIKEHFKVTSSITRFPFVQAYIEELKHRQPFEVVEIFLNISQTLAKLRSIAEDWYDQLVFDVLIKTGAKQANIMSEDVLQELLGRVSYG